MDEEALVVGADDREEHMWVQGDVLRSTAVARCPERACIVARWCPGVDPAWAIHSKIPGAGSAS
jgi:hypothetical protein